MADQDLPISDGLVKYLEDKSNSQISSRKSADALCLEVVSDRNMPAFVGLVDEYYLSKGFKLAQDSSVENYNFALRTFRHRLAGSSIQTMIAERAKFEYILFINDYEDKLAKERRALLGLSQPSVNKGHN